MNNLSNDYRDIDVTELCQDGCEKNYWVDWVGYILEVVTIPMMGLVGLLGNIFSIIILVKTEGKTTFHQVKDYYSNHVTQTFILSISM